MDLPHGHAGKFFYACVVMEATIGLAVAHAFVGNRRE